MIGFFHCTWWILLLTLGFLKLAKVLGHHCLVTKNIYRSTKRSIQWKFCNADKNRYCVILLKREVSSPVWRACLRVSNFSVTNLWKKFESLANNIDPNRKPVAFFPLVSKVQLIASQFHISTTGFWWFCNKIMIEKDHSAKNLHSMLHVAFSINLGDFHRFSQNFDFEFWPENWQSIGTWRKYYSMRSVCIFNF